MALVDYGAVVFKNGVCQNPNLFCMNMEDTVGWRTEDSGNSCVAYAGDEHLTVGFFKSTLYIYVDNKQVLQMGGMADGVHSNSIMSRHFSYGGVDFHLRRLNKYERTMYLQFSYKGDHYNVVYGYGIDTDPTVWNSTKKRYLGARVSRHIDNLYRTFLRSKGERT